MNKEESGRQERKCTNLTHLLNEISEQEDIIKGLVPRSASWQGAPDSVMKVLRNLFRETAEALPEKHISFDDNNDLDGLRAQLSSLRAKVTQAQIEIDGKPPQISVNAPTLQHSERMYSSKSQVSNAPDWGKHAVIAAWAIGIPGLGLAVINYLLPPDPAHPIGFSFLSRSYSVPAWLMGVAGTAVIWLATLVWRARSKPQTPSQARAERIIGELSGKLEDAEHFNQQAHEKISALETQNHSLQQKALPKRVDEMIIARAAPKVAGATARAELTVAKKPLAWDANIQQIIFDLPDHLSIEIKKHTDEKTGTTGVIASVVNGSPEWLNSFNLEIVDATNWSEKHQKFLPSRNFGRASFNKGGNLKPEDKSGAQWLVLMTQDGPTMTGQASRLSLPWPNTDPSEIRIWRISLAISYHLGEQRPSTIQPQLKGAGPQNLLVRWDRASNSLDILDGIGYE